MKFHHRIVIEGGVSKLPVAQYAVFDSLKIRIYVDPCCFSPVVEKEQLAQAQRVSRFSLSFEDRLGDYVFPR